VRPHYDGIPREERYRGAPARQRNPKSTDSFQDTRVGVPLTLGEARRTPGLRNPSRGIYAAVKPGPISGNEGAAEIIMEVLS